MNIPLLLSALSSFDDDVFEMILQCLIRTLDAQDLFNLSVQAFAAFIDAVNHCERCRVEVDWLLYKGSRCFRPPLRPRGDFPAISTCSRHVEYQINRGPFRQEGSDEKEEQVYHELAILCVAHPRAAIHLVCDEE